MDAYIEDDKYGQDESHPYLCFGVTMAEETSGKYSYSISYNTTGGPGMEDVARTDEPRSDPIAT